MAIKPLAIAALLSYGKARLRIGEAEVSDLFRKCFFFGVVLTSLSSASAIAQQANSGNWQRVEADNGAIYQVDMSSIDRIRNGTATVRIWVMQGTNFNPR